MKNLSGASLFMTRRWVMVSLINRPDAEFVCACWEPLVPNGNIQTTSTRGVWRVTGLWTELTSEFGQCAGFNMKGLTAILALGDIKGVCGQT
jgi:hypothetical protein